VLAFDAGIYDWIKLVHILAAIVWVGGGVFVQVYSSRLRRATDQTRLLAFAKDLEKVGTRLFQPAAIIVLVMGIVLVWYSPAWEITQLWVILGLVGIANSIVVGAVFLGPEAGRIARIAEEKGPDDPEVVARTVRVFNIGTYDLAVLILVVVDMVVKPGL